MRHKRSGRKLSRSTPHRRALLRNMATSLIKHEKFETTIEKAKEIRPVVEKLITKAKSGSLAARRAALGYLQEKAVVHKLFAEVAPRFAGRNGGYCRITRTGIRNGDTAQLAIIEFVDGGSASVSSTASDETTTETKTTKAKAAPKKKTATPKAKKAVAS